MFNDEEKFDLKIRSVLEGGREEVPDHIWDRIEARLDGATPSAVPHKRDRHVLMLWLRRAGTGIAAAEETDSPEKQFSCNIHYCSIEMTFEFTALHQLLPNLPASIEYFVLSSSRLKEPT